MKVSELVDEYVLSQKRLFLLDYDGTLTPVVGRPEDARPSHELLRLLRKLSEDDKNTIVIISGRQHDELEKWLGSLPIEFVAEHSVWRRNKMGVWTMTIERNEAQNTAAATLLTRLGSLHAGAVLEKKRVGIALHYRHAPSLNDGQVRQWIEQNTPTFRANKLKPIHGKKIIELVPLGVDKGTAAAYWLRDTHGGLIVAAGDDTTDESMFAALPAKAVSIRVGQGESIAQITVDSPSDFLDILEQMTSL